MTPALILALSLMASSAPPPADGGEPLPPGAPTDEYELSAWCYGALSEYLSIYDKVKPDLVDIDKLFGDPVKEDEPYQSDIAAARKELKMIGGAVTLAEKASAQPIAPQGAEALRMGRAIWSVAETKTSRELARAWLTWGLPDRCDSVSRQLAAKSLLLGKALSYNQGQSAPAEDDAATSTVGSTSSPQPSPQPAAETPPATAGFARTAPLPAPGAASPAAAERSAGAAEPPAAAPASRDTITVETCEPRCMADKGTTPLTTTPVTTSPAAEATPQQAPQAEAPAPPPPTSKVGETPSDQPQEPLL